MSESSELRERADELLRLISRAERLESFPRAGWIVCGVDRPESVAAHVHGVALIAMWIADHLDEAVDTERVLRIALLHDIGEALLTDLPWPIKKFVGSEPIADAEERATDVVLADCPPAWKEAVSAYEELDSLEARIVKAADKIQMLAKSLQYRKQNRGDVERFWEVERNFDDYGIPLVEAIVERLQEHFEDGTWYDSGYE